jgi:hypothetical protein
MNNSDKPVKSFHLYHSKLPVIASPWTDQQIELLGDYRVVRNNAVFFKFVPSFLYLRNQEWGI